MSLILKYEEADINGLAGLTKAEASQCESAVLLTRVKTEPSWSDAQCEEVGQSLMLASDEIPNTKPGWLKDKDATETVESISAPDTGLAWSGNEEGTECKVQPALELECEEIPTTMPSWLTPKDAVSECVELPDPIKMKGGAECETEPPLQLKCEVEDDASEGYGELWQVEDDTSEGYGELREVEHDASEGYGELREVEHDASEGYGDLREVEHDASEDYGEQREIEDDASEGYGELREVEHDESEGYGEQQEVEDGASEGYGELQEVEDDESEGYGKQSLAVKLDTTMYVVVVFESESTETVGLIPSCWLLSPKEAVWPPFPSPAAISKAVKDCLAPDLENWSRHSIRTLCACSTYLNGRTKVREAEETSDICLTADESSMGRGARKRKPRNLTPDDSEDEVPPPKKSKSATLARAPTPPPVPIPQVAPSPSTSSVESAATLMRDMRNVSPVVSARDRELMRGIGELQVSIDSLQREQKSLKKLMHKILDKLGNGTTLPELGDIVLPLRTLEEVTALNERLGDPDVKASLESRLALIGGDNLKRAVGGVMRQVLHNDVALLHNWSGQTGWKGGAPKRAFGGTALCGTIIRGILRNPEVGPTTEAAVGNEIKNWLRNASDRNGGRKRRADMRAAEEQRSD